MPKFVLKPEWIKALLFYANLSLIFLLSFKFKVLFYLIHFNVTLSRAFIVQTFFDLIIGFKATNLTHYIVLPKTCLTMLLKHPLNVEGLT